jgi:hypothetical protein
LTVTEAEVESEKESKRTSRLGAAAWRALVAVAVAAAPTVIRKILVAKTKNVLVAKTTTKKKKKKQKKMWIWRRDSACCWAGRFSWRT